MGISAEDFLRAIATFGGAAKRLQVLKEARQSVAFLDFAHSPSKLRATTEAVRERYPHRKLVACMELHTFSSLTKAFLPQYAHTMDSADEALVFFNPEVIEHKRLEPITTEDVKQGFGRADLQVFTSSAELCVRLGEANYNNTVLLIMTSGNFSGVDLRQLADKLIK